ncbi:hypothetical protein FACS1894217_13350 [Clostridia bacterium]|nr:hypothetical protein FACS1894217_13350 [Clostridia bacterium]
MFLFAAWDIDNTLSLVGLIGGSIGIFGGTVGAVTSIIVAKINTRGKTAQSISLEQADADSYELLQYIKDHSNEREAVGEYITTCKAIKPRLTLPESCDFHHSLYLDAPENAKDDAWELFLDECAEARDHYRKRQKFGRLNLSTGRIFGPQRKVDTLWWFFFAAIATIPILSLIIVSTLTPLSGVPLLLTYFVPIVLMVYIGHRLWRYEKKVRKLLERIKGKTN